MPASQNFTVYQGTTGSILLTFELLTIPSLPFNSISNPYIPINLTGATITLTCRATYNSPIIVLQKTTTTGGIFITNPTAGLATIQFVPADTSELFMPLAAAEAGSWDTYYDIFVFDTFGNGTCCFAGTMTFTEMIY
jgi:hypothetical protein